MADTAAAAEATKADLEKQLEEAKAGFHMPELKAPAANFADKYLAEGQRSVTDISVQAVRMGNIAGIHEVFFGTDTETITLKHEAHDRGVFADGALAAAQFIVGKPAGLYNME